MAHIHTREKKQATTNFVEFRFVCCVCVYVCVSGFICSEDQILSTNHVRSSFYAINGRDRRIKKNKTNEKKVQRSHSKEIPSNWWQEAESCQYTNIGMYIYIDFELCQSIFPATQSFFFLLFLSTRYKVKVSAIKPHQIENNRYYYIAIVELNLHCEEQSTVANIIRDVETWKLWAFSFGPGKFVLIRIASDHSFCGFT